MKILIIGGTQFFGKRLVESLIEGHNDVTLITRGLTEHSFGSKVQHLRLDREDLGLLASITKGKTWDVVVDQVCFNAQTAIDACEVFFNKTNHYIFTSSQSVYSLGDKIKESEFEPTTYRAKKEVLASENYGEAKRQAEAAFYQKAEFKVTAARFPIVMGPDDYTDRFKSYVSSISKGTPINLPNPSAEISFISSQDAARALEHLIRHPLGQPINLSAYETFKIENFLKTIEKISGKKTTLDSECAVSPYGVSKNWTMDTALAKSIGYNPLDNWDWVEDTVKDVYENMNS